MNDDWEKMTLGDFITLQRGHDLPESERREGNVPVVGSFGITGYHDTARAKAPGVTVGRSGASFGTIFFCPVDFWPHNAALYVTDFHGNDEKFAYYFLKTFDFTRYNSGSAQPSLNRNYIYPIPITVPPPNEQREIANILGALDDKIEANRRENETLEAMAHALFKSWFVDFDPVHAKVNGEAPYGMDAETAALFPDSFEPSELGMIPSGWTVDILSSVVEINPRLSLKKGQIAPYVEMANLPTSSVRITDWQLREYGSGMRFMNGDVLLARITPCLENGKTGYVDFLDDNEIGWGSTEYIVLRQTERLNSEYIYCLARFEDFRQFAIQNMTGTSGRQRVNANAFDHYNVVTPNTEVLKVFQDTVKIMFEKIRTNDEESRTLAETRDALLPRLISGELRVGDL